MLLQEVPDCVSCLPLTDFLWLKILIAIIQFYCLSLFILVDVFGVSVFLSTSHYFMERGTKITPWCGKKNSDSLSLSERSKR